MAVKREFTEEEKALIIRLYQDGETLSNIKKTVHCSHDTLKDFLKNSGINERTLISQKKRIFTYKEKSKIIKMCKENKTIDEICKEVSCCDKVLNRFLRENGLHKQKSKSGPPRLTHEGFLKQLYEVSNDIIPIDDYVKRDTQMHFRCNKCEYEWQAFPGNILSGCGCPNCSGRILYTQETFVEKINSINPKIEIIGEYNGMRNRILCRCRICKTEWSPLASTLTHIGGCPTCKESYGERQIRKYLEYNNINFIAQYKFADCKRKKPLPFDFYLPDINMVIEYDGQQHFGDVEVFGGTDRFLYTQENDNIKNQYCELNNINLVRIPFWELDNIDYILSNIFTQQND